MFLGAVCSQEDKTDISDHSLQLTYQDNVVECNIVNVGDENIFQPEDCDIKLYIRSELVGTVRGLQIQHTYLVFLKSTVRCEAQCENNNYIDDNITPTEIDIRKTKKTEINLTLIGVFVGAAVGLIIAFSLVMLYQRRRIRDKQVATSPSPPP